MGLKMQVPCVGGQHHNYSIAREMGAAKQGAKVTLVREPTNSYDSNAIKCMVAGDESQGQPAEFMLGYVKKNFAADLSHHMDKGMKVEGTIVLLRANSCSIDVTEVEDGKAGE